MRIAEQVNEEAFWTFKTEVLRIQKGENFQARKSNKQKRNKINKDLLPDKQKRKRETFQWRQYDCQVRHNCSNWENRQVEGCLGILLSEAIIKRGIPSGQFVPPIPGSGRFMSSN